MGKSFERIISDRYNDESFELYDKLKYGNPPEYFVEAKTRTRRGYYKKLGPLIGITETNELGKLRIKITEDPSEKIPTLSSVQGNLSTVNFLRDYYGFNPISQEEYDAITASSQEVSGEEDEDQEPQVKGTETTPEPQEMTLSADDSLTSLEVEVIPAEIPEQSNLDNLITATAETIVKESGSETASSEVEGVDIIQEKLLADANISIQKFQEFAQNHPAHTRDKAMQEEFRRLERESWEAQRRLAHSNGGEIITLPQQRDIELSHPETIDMRGYLESIGYQLDKNGDITHITNKSDVIELTRPYNINALINTSRPSHIVYDKNVNLDDRNSLTYHHGYLIRGLNKDTPKFILHTLSTDEFIQGVITDETLTKNIQPDIASQSNANKRFESSKLPLIEIPSTAINNRPLDENNLRIAAENLMNWVNSSIPNAVKHVESLEEVKNIIRAKGSRLMLEHIPSLNMDQAHDDKTRGKETEFTDAVRRAYMQFYLSESTDVDSTLDSQNIVNDEMAATSTPEIDMSEYERLGLSDEQLSRIKTVLSWAHQGGINGVTLERLVKYTDNTFSVDQSKEILLGFHYDLADDEVAQYSSPDISVEEMKAKRNELVQAKNKTSEGSEFEPNSIVKEKPLSVATENGIPSDKGESILQNEIDKLRVAYARAEEFYNRNRRDEDAKVELDRIREEYNQTIEKVFGIMVAEGVEKDIHTIFVQEVYNLREARITQSKELQSGFERAMNPIKEKLLNFAIKNKKLWAGINIALAVGGGFFALSGAGLPVAGALEATRRSIAGIMAGVSAREGTRALLEDADVKLGKLKWQSVIPKLVSESLQDGYIEAATDTDLSAKLSTLEAYYRLNGGTFTNDSQQKAYETILTALGQRVQEKTIENNQPKENNDSKLMKGEEGKEETSSSTDSEVNNTVSTPEQNNARYTSELLKVMSEKRISELQKQQKKRLIANIVGTAVGGGLMTSLAVDMMRPSGALNPDQVSEAPNASETVEPPSTPNSTESPANPIELNIPSPSEAAPSVAETAAETAQQLSPEQLQDISELREGETLWGEIAKKLGENATDTQIQQAVEAYMGTSEGQETMFSLASKTKGGRALLSQWGIDNATELSQVSKTDLYELSRHLGVGELNGLDTLDLSNLPPLDEISTPTGFNPAESASSGVTPPGAESVPQVDQNVFMSEVTKTLGIDKVNLTETEFTNIMYSYLETEQGRDALYNLAISDESGKLLLEQFGVNSLEDFSKLSAPELYDIAQSVDLTNLEGFNFNDIMLSKFENAPDSISLIKGAGPLTQVNQYIDLYAGGLPYDSTLGQEVLTTYLQTPEGKDWVYDAIVNNPDTLNGNENVQWAKEYIRYRDIQQGSDIDWTTLSQDRKFPTSIFWKETVLTGGRRLPPLSTLLKPGEMPGIKKALEKVLTLKQ